MKFTEIANSLRDERREFLKQISEATEVHPSTALRWVTGDSVPSARNRRIIAETLNSPVESLFPEHEKQTTP